MTSSLPTRYDALILDPESNNRIRLKQACSAVSTFAKVYQYPYLADGLRALADGAKTDVVFVSKAFGQEAVSAFIKDAKSTKSGEDAAYILVLPEDGASATVAQSVLGGADGLLFAPYSVDRLVEITVLAAKVKKERSTAREEAAFRFLINDMLTQIDLLAYSKSCGYDAGTAIKNFKQACSVLSTLTPESLEIYYRVAVDVFEKAPLPTGLMERKKYGGASNRIKKRMGDKLAAEIASSPKGS